MRIIIVQSTGPDTIEYLLKRRHLQLLQEHDFIFTDSFEYALLQTPKSGEVSIITSDMFHEERCSHKNLPITVPDGQKNANTLAQSAKAKNPEAKVYAYSTARPDSEKYLDKSFRKSNDQKDDLLEILKEIFYKSVFK